MTRRIEDEIKEKEKRDRALDDLELPEGMEIDVLAEDRAKGYRIKNELEVFEAPMVARSFYDSAVRFAKTAYGLAMIGFVFFMVGALYWGVGKTEVVLTPEYQKTHEQLQDFEEYTRQFEALGIKFEKPQELAEREFRVREAVRWMEELNSKGKSIKGVEDIHPGLTTRRKASVWKAKYDGWYNTPRTMDEMFFYSLPLLGSILVVSIPFVLVQAVRGGRAFVVTNHTTGEKATYIIDESKVSNIYDPVLRIWRLPVVNQLTLNFTGQYDIIPDDAFITEVRKGMKSGGIFAEPEPDVIGRGKEGNIRRIYKAVPNQHGYYGELAFKKEVNYIKNIDELRQENVEIKRLKTHLQLQLARVMNMTPGERMKFARGLEEDAFTKLERLGQIRAGGGSSDAKRKYKPPKSKDSPSEENAEGGGAQ